MKLIDKFLKKLKTDRNTFFTYILTLLTAYIIVDRVVEWLIMSFTGMSVDYWNPIQYTLALACPVFAFFLSFASKFVKADKAKISFFYAYCIALYIVAISMVVQLLNHVCWIGLLSLPNYAELITDFSDLIIPALTAISLYIPLTTFYKLLRWLYIRINDPIFPNNFKDSICDYSGIDISAPDDTTGPYSFEVELCKDRGTGKPVMLLESRRFQPTLVVGPANTGKTSMVMEPMIARDLEKKFFFRETAKEMGYTALKTGIATLNRPYNNEYINKNFSLTMLTPVEGKEDLYKAYMKKMIYTINPDGSIIYKNFGITSVTSDYEHTARILEVAKNLDIPVNLVDPVNYEESIGLNPFALIDSPPLCGLIISLILRAWYNPDTFTAELAYMEDISKQAVQNLVLLLKCVYPKLNNGDIPTIEDLSRCFLDFDYVVELCEELKKDEFYSKEYSLQITYFEQNFYRNSTGYKDMKRYLQLASAQLDIVLKSPSLKAIVCNRHNNIDFTKVINNGEVTLLCTRPFEVGGAQSKAFGLFFLMEMMCHAEIPRETTPYRIPHFLYVDDFDRYANGILGDMITIYNKFKIGIILSIQNLASICGGINSPFTQTLLSNSPTKISFGNHTPEEYDWWLQEFGKRREWKVSPSYDPTKNRGEYSSSLGSPEWSWQDTMKLGKMQGLAFKSIIFKTKDKKGKNVVNFGKVDFLESKYKEPKKIKMYKFDKYNESDKQQSDKASRKKFNYKRVKFDSNNDEEVDPIQTDTTDSSYFFNNEDAISFNFGNNKK